MSKPEKLFNIRNKRFFHHYFQKGRNIEKCQLKIDGVMEEHQKLQKKEAELLKDLMEISVRRGSIFERILSGQRGCSFCNLLWKCLQCFFTYSFIENLTFPFSL